MRPLFIDGVEVCELTGARRLFKLTRDLVYQCDRTGATIRVPAGFCCDLGSIPAFARWALSPDDPWAAAFALHDWLYRVRALPRIDCDKILRDALGLPFRAYDERGAMFRIVCPAPARLAIYAAVRIGGASSYA